VKEKAKKMVEDWGLTTDASKKIMEARLGKMAQRKKKRRS